MAQVPEPLSPTWETQMIFQFLGLALVWPWLSRRLQQGDYQQMEKLCLSLPLSLTLPFKWINRSLKRLDSIQFTHEIWTLSVDSLRPFSLMVVKLSYCSSDMNADLYFHVAKSKMSVMKLYEGLRVSVVAWAIASLIWTAFFSIVCVLVIAQQAPWMNAF